MRIGIFETEHFEGAYPIIRLFDNGQHEITIFTYEKPYRQFRFLFGEQMNRYKWIVKKDDENKYAFIKKIYRETRAAKLELLYMNTVQDNHLFYACLVALLPKVRIVATLHDVNSYFRFRPALSIRRWVRYIGKRFFISSVKEFNVVSDTMVGHLKSQLPAHKKVYSLPGAVYEMEKPYGCISPADEGVVKLVVPGTIDGRRRDYEQVFELLQACNLAGINISVVLLGGYYGEYGHMILEKCRVYAQQHNNLRFYTGLVDQPEFDRVMNEAHLVFTPTVIDTILFDGIEETYGLSISSGNIFDIIKHAKPFISPATLRVPDRLKSSCITYTSVEEICDFLRKSLHDASLYNELSKEAELNSQKYTIARVRERNPTLFA